MTLKELKELAKNATPRRWKYCDGDIDFNVTDEINGFIAGQAVEDDAAFISAARNHIEELIERYEKAVEEIQYRLIVHERGCVSKGCRCIYDFSREYIGKYGPHVPLGEKNG